MMKFYNSHTHKISDPEIASVYSPYDDFSKEELNQHKYWSIGIHPWLTNKDELDTFKLQFSKLAQNSRCVAIGEIGLDKLRGAPLSRQSVLLKELLDEAYRLGHKTIVLHCVKAFNEIFPILSYYQDHFKFVFHDFHGNTEIIEQFSRFNSFYSVSPRGFKGSKSSVERKISAIPFERILIETDDSEMSIQEVYKRISEIKKIEMNELCVQIEKNFFKSFPKFPINRET